MSKVLIDTDTFEIMALFTKITKVPVQDCFFEEERVTFVVPQGPKNVYKAIGPNGSTIKKLETKLNKKVRVVEHSDKITKFIKNLILPLKADEIVETEENIYTIKSEDMKTKGLIIGRNAKNLRALETHVQRYFKDLKEIKVE